MNDELERRYQPFIRESFYVTGTPAHQRKVIPKRQADGSDINSAKETQESIRLTSLPSQIFLLLIVCNYLLLLFGIIKRKQEKEVNYEEKEL